MHVCTKQVQLCLLGWKLIIFHFLTFHSMEYVLMTFRKSERYSWLTLKWHSKGILNRSWLHLSLISVMEEDRTSMNKTLQPPKKKSKAFLHFLSLTHSRHLKTLFITTPKKSAKKKAGICFCFKQKVRMGFQDSFSYYVFMSYGRCSSGRWHR